MATTSALQLQTYESILTTTTTSAVTTFSNIPQKYNNLIIVMCPNNVSLSTVEAAQWQINGDTGANYARPSSGWGITNYMSTSVVGTITAVADNYIRYGNPAFCLTQKWEFPNYSRSGIKKAAYGEYSYGAGATVTAGSWNGTDAITSLTLTLPSNSGGAVISLYGVKAA